MSDNQMIAIVFIGAFIGGFVVWPMLRPMFVPAPQAQQAATQQQGYAPQRGAAR